MCFGAWPCVRACDSSPSASGAAGDVKSGVMSRRPSPRKATAGMEEAAVHRGVLALLLLLLAVCAVPAHAETVPMANLVLDLEPGDKPACVRCNDAQLSRCWTNLREAPAYPAGGLLALENVCNLSPAMEAFWACLRACAGDGACSSDELSQMGMRECEGNPIPCNLGGCPDCPEGLSEVMTMACKGMSEDFWFFPREPPPFITSPAYHKHRAICLG